MATSIYITYNPNSDLERTLAIRLHTIGAVNGFTMYLPDRHNSELNLDSGSKSRIQDSEWFIYFSTQPISNIVQREIEYALSIFPNPQNIIIVYSSLTGKNIRGTEHCTEIFFDPRTEMVDHVVQSIFQQIWHKQKQQTQASQTKETKQENNALLALLGIGVGFLALAALSNNDKTENKTKKPNRNTKPRKITKAKKQ